MTTESSVETPAMFDHCAKVYEALRTMAVEEQYVLGDDTEVSGEHAIEFGCRWVFEGHTTQVFSRLGLATPYYTSVLKNLVAMGCVTQIRRGGGSSLSKWELHKPPTEELWATRDIRGGSKNATRLSALEQQVRDLNNRLKKIEKAVGM